MNRRTFLGRALATVGGAVAAAKVGAPPTTQAVAAPVQGHIPDAPYVDLPDNTEYISAPVLVRHSADNPFFQNFANGNLFPYPPPNGLSLYMDERESGRVSLNAWGRAHGLNVRTPESAEPNGRG